MKILVLGASGMAGHVISLYFAEKGYEVDTFTRSPLNIGNNIQGDLLDSKQLSLLLRNHYDYIINAVGMLNKECELHPDRAVFLNSYLPHYIVRLIDQRDTKLIHMSTDCVFSGKRAPYFEQSFTDGETMYDRSKALGEIWHSRHLTFRNSIIGPDTKIAGIGLFNWFMKQQGEISGYRKAVWNGVTTITLAKAMEQAMQEQLSGLYHLVPDSSINKYELLQLFQQHFNRPVQITASDEFIIDKTLINRRSDFSFKVPSYEQMVEEMKQWIDKHQSWYPHYYVTS